MMVSYFSLTPIGYFYYFGLGSYLKRRRTIKNRKKFEISIRKGISKEDVVSNKHFHLIYIDFNFSPFTKDVTIEKA